MDKEIRIEIENTVIISTEEYRRLVTAQAYLDAIISARNASSGYAVGSTVEIISRLFEPVKTENAENLDDGKGETLC